MFIRRFLAAAAFALASAAAPAVFAHAKLQSSDPPAGSTLAHAPEAVRLKFNEALEPAFSKIRLLDAGNKEIALAGTIVGKPDPTAMTVALPPLAAGDYRIKWSAMGHDGHTMKGDVPFRVK